MQPATGNDAQGGVGNGTAAPGEMPVEQSSSLNGDKPQVARKGRAVQGAVQKRRKDQPDDSAPAAEASAGPAETALVSNAAPTTPTASAADKHVKAGVTPRTYIDPQDEQSDGDRTDPTLPAEDGPDHVHLNGGGGKTADPECPLQQEALRKANRIIHNNLGLGIFHLCKQEQPHEPLKITGQDVHFQLWKAARLGDAVAVKDALDQGARHDAELGPDAREWLQDDAPLVIAYKGRAFDCQPLHAAAFFHGHTENLPLPSENGWQQSWKVAELLLQAHANPCALARSVVQLKDGNSQERQIQAIHLAAGIGNVGTLKLLLEHKADPDAAAVLNKKVHYVPLHDAIWFNRGNSLQWLLKAHANIHATNMQEQTGMHIAAQLGYSKLVEAFFEQDQEESGKMAQMEDLNKKLPLDLAVEKGRFPPRDLYLFTLRLPPQQQVQAFLTVARSCPSAASALLQHGCSPSDMDRGISSTWRKSLQEGAEDGTITVRVFAKLLREAPAAALALLEALTDVPEVVSPEYHPLPIRAQIPRSSEPCQMSVTYQVDSVWRWTPATSLHDGGMPWHHGFATPDPKKGREVKVQTLKVRGIADLQVFMGLAATSDFRLFTKVMVQALLRFAWHQLEVLFILEFIHEALATAVINCWIADSWWQSWEPEWQPFLAHPGELTRRAMWLCVASEGSLELLTMILCAWSAWSHTETQDNKPLGFDARPSSKSFLKPEIKKQRDSELAERRKQALKEWCSRSWFRILLGVITVALAEKSHESYWPEVTLGSSALLAASSLLHWCHLLYKLRAFPWTGQRLLPIMKSIEPIVGMLVIMLFLLCAFMSAIWALNRSNTSSSGMPNDGIMVFNVLIHLMAGELMYMDNEDIRSMGKLRQFLVMSLGASATFIFLACALNVFIAVLGDCYDQEQERTVCTFMKERAKICSDLVLRPQIALASLSDSKLTRPRLIFWSFAGGTFALCTLMLWVSFEVGFTAWVPTIIFNLSVLFGKAILRNYITLNWDESFLWMCVDATVDEEMFMAPDESPVESHGRLCIMKRYIHEKNKAVTHHCQTAVDQVKKCRASIDASLTQGITFQDRDNLDDATVVKEDLRKMERRLEAMHDEHVAALDRQQEVQAQLLDTCEELRRALTQLTSGDKALRPLSRVEMKALPLNAAATAEKSGEKSLWPTRTKKKGVARGAGAGAAAEGVPAQKGSPEDELTTGPDAPSNAPGVD